MPADEPLTPTFPIDEEVTPVEPAYPIEETPIVDAPDAIEEEPSEIEQWIFDNYDTNGNGKISNEEAKALIRDIQSYDITKETIPLAEIDYWFNNWDTNKDGNLSIKEFIRALA
jgi:EF-hand domain pair